MKDDPVRKVQDVRGGTVVLLETEEARSGIPVLEGEDVVDLRAPEGVDALAVVAHNEQVPVLFRQAVEDAGLEGIGILVFVHEHMAEAVPQKLQCSRALLEEPEPEDEQIVEVQDPVLLLGRPVAGRDGFDPVQGGQEPGGAPSDQFVDGKKEIGGKGEEVLESRGRRNPLCAGQGSADLVPDLLDKIPLVFPVKECAGAVDADPGTELPDQAKSHMMEGAGPWDDQELSHELSQPRLHDLRGFFGEGQEKKTGRGDSPGQEMGGPVGENPGLPRSGSCQHESGAFGCQDGGGLFFVQILLGKGQGNLPAMKRGFRKGDPPDQKSMLVTGGRDSKAGRAKK